MLPICTMFSMRVTASRVVLAWTVDMLPSWPVFIACSMSNASAAADLADDDAVGPHAQRVANQVALGDLATSLQAGRAGFHAHHMRLLQLQFGGILDGDDALAVIDRSRHGVHQRGLAGPVPPEMMMLRRARPAISSRGAYDLVFVD